MCIAGDIYLIFSRDNLIQNIVPETLYLVSRLDVKFFWEKKQAQSPHLVCKKM